MKKKFKKSYLVDELELPYEQSDGKVKIISDDIYDTDRWSEIHDLVFQLGEQIGTNFAWQTNYSRGATELQDEQPWEMDDEIECYLVEEKEVVVKQWCLVESEEKAYTTH